MPIMAELDEAISEGKHISIDKIVTDVMDMVNSPEVKYYTELLLKARQKWGTLLGENETTTSNLAPLVTQPAAYTEIPEYQHGTMYAPGGFAKLHEGEIVVPPAESARIRAEEGETPKIYVDMRGSSFGTSAQDASDGVLDGIERAQRNNKGARRPILSRTQTAGVRIIN